MVGKQSGVEREHPIGAPPHPTEVVIFISGLFQILGLLGGSEGLRVWGLEGFFF